MSCVCLDPDQKGVHPLHTLDAKGVKNINPLATSTLEDFWMVPLAPWEEEELACCCSAIARPQLLLPAALEVAEPPDFATLPSSELRRLCQVAGIKWRSVNGTKHLSKNQMILALNS